MGTRADFYIEKKDKSLEWLGSISFDGYEIDNVEGSKTPRQYKSRLKSFLKNRDDATFPEQGWPWPWDNSKLTDEIYIFAKDRIYQKFERGAPGHNDHTIPMRFIPYPIKFDKEGEIKIPKTVKTVYLPDMKDRKNVAIGKRSGLIVASISPNDINIT